MDTITNWSHENHLSLNINKTKFMLISRSKQYSQCPQILLDGIQLEQVFHFKYLGVWFSADLTWSKHIMSVTCKARRLLGYIFRTFSPHCSPPAIMALYRTQVLPILDYGCIIWDPHFKKDCGLLDSVQLFAARMATKSWNANAVTLNSELNLTTLSSRRAYFKVLYVYKFLNGYLYCPPGLFVLRSNVTTRINYPKQLLQPFAKTSAFFNSFFISSTKLWNALPAEAVLNSSISSFKNSVTALYFAS